MSAVIVPCITTQNIADFQTKVNQYQAFTKRVHIDLSDGQFAPTILIPESQIYWPSDWQVDIHLMLARPSQVLDELIARKPFTIIFHAESGEPLQPLIDKVKQSGIRVGLALLKTTVPSTVEPLIKSVDHVMIFSGDLGKYGGQASIMQTEKVRLVKNIKEDIEIGWDGGVSLDNAFTIASSGVDVLNAGGAIANSPNPADTFNQLTNEANKKGVI